MLKFLKNIFMQKEIKNEEINLNELEGWIESNKKIILNDLNKKTDEIMSRISNEVRKCNENLRALENAELANPKIPLRAKQAMEGNRETYIKRINLFLAGIDLKEADYGKLLDFCTNFEIQAGEVAKSTFKSYQVLQHFFANESSDIAKNIKYIDDNVKEIRHLIVSSKVSSIDCIKNEILGLRMRINRKNKLEEGLSGKEKLIEELKELKAGLAEEINDFSKSEEYTGFKILKDNKASIEKEIGAHTASVIHSFSVLEKALKKFSRISLEDEKLINNYLVSPVKTLAEDKGLRIKKVLDNLKGNLLRNKLELEEKKVQKSLSEIEKLSVYFFMYFLAAYNELEERLKNTCNELENNIAEKKYIELNNRMGLLNLQMERLEEDINGLKQESGKIDIQALKTSLQEKVNSALNKCIIIS